MGTSPKREARILYFNYNWNWRSETKLADRWAYHCLPISTELIITSNPTLPDNIAENFDEIKRQFLGYLDDLYAENGVMYGWKVHSIEGPVGSPFIDGGDRAKVIQVRETKEDTASDSK